MHLEVTFRNLNAREEVRQRAQALFKKLERFLDAASEAQMVVGVEHGLAVVEMVVTSRGATHKITEEDADLRTALDRLMHSMENQLRRAKERRNDRRGSEAEVDGFSGAGEPVEEDEEQAL
jgi:ribosomal subunit interface protein